MGNLLIVVVSKRGNLNKNGDTEQKWPNHIFFFCVDFLCGAKRRRREREKILGHSPSLTCWMGVFGGKPSDELICVGVSGQNMKKIGKYREEQRNTTSTNKIRHHGVDTSSPMFWIQWYDWKVSTQILMDPMLKPSFVRSWDSRPFLQRNWTRDISQWGDALISAWLQLSWGFPTVGNWFLFLSQPYQLIELLALIHWFPQESLVSSAQSTPMPMPQDICTKRRDLHGEGQGYEKRCMLIYVAGPDLG